MHWLNNFLILKITDFYVLKHFSRQLKGIISTYISDNFSKNTVILFLLLKYTLDRDNNNFYKTVLATFLLFVNNRKFNVLFKINNVDAFAGMFVYKQIAL